MDLDGESILHLRIRLLTMDRNPGLRDGAAGVNGDDDGQLGPSRLNKTLPCE